MADHADDDAHNGPREAAAWPAEFDGRFQHISCLGAGASGTAWCVRIPWSGVLCTLKLFHEPDPAWPPPAWAGIQRVHHPALLPIHELGTLADGRPWVCRTFADGIALGEADGPLSEAALLQCTHRILGLLEHIHGAGYVHGDIKPDNIVVRLDRDRLVGAWLIDFGLAEAVADVEDRGARGTVPYMAPEMFTERRGSAGVDLYALAMSLYQAATGTPPYPVDDHEEIVPRIVKREILERTHVLPPAFREFVEFAVRHSGSERLTCEAARALLPPPPVAIAPAQTRVGRDATMRALRDRLLRATSSTELDSIVLLDGPRGLGKRTVAQLVADELRFRSDAPRLVDIDSGTVSEPWLVTAGAALGQVPPEGEAIEVRLHAAACQIAAATAPVVILVSTDTWDELDDRALAIVAGQLAATPSAPVGLLIASSRGYTAWTHRPTDGVSIVELDPLDEDDLVAIAEQTLGRGSAWVARRLAGLAAGNPGTLAELLELFEHDASIDRATNLESLGEALRARRTADLTSEHRSALAVVGVLGDAVSVEHLHLLGVDATIVDDLARRDLFVASRQHGVVRLAADARERWTVDALPSSRFAALAEIARERLAARPDLARTLAVVRISHAAGALDADVWREAFDRRLLAHGPDATIAAISELLTLALQSDVADDRDVVAAGYDILARAHTMTDDAGFTRATDVLQAWRERGVGGLDDELELVLLGIGAERSQLSDTPARLDSPAVLDTMTGRMAIAALHALSTLAKSRDRSDWLDALQPRIEEALETAASDVERTLVWRAAVRFAGLLNQSRQHARSEAFARRVLDRMPSFPPSMERIDLTRVLCSSLLSRNDTVRALELLDRAGRTAEEYGWIRLSLNVLNSRILALCALERMGEAKELTERALAAMIRVGDWVGAVHAIGHLSNIYTGLGAYREGITAIERALTELPAEVRDSYAIRNEFSLLRLRRLADPPPQARATIRDFTELASSTSMWKFLEPWVLGYTAETWAHEGDWQKTADVAAQTLAAATAANVLYYRCFAHLLRAEAALNFGQLGVAREELDAAADIDTHHRALRWRIEYLRARIARTEANEDAFLRHLRQAIEPIHEILNGLTGRYRDTFAARRDVAPVLDLEQRALASSETERTLDRAREIIEIAKDLLTSASRAYADTLQEALRRMTSFAGAERGALLTVSERDGERVFQQVAFVGQSRREPLKTSRTVLEQVVATRRHVMSADALIDRRFSTAGSVLDLGVRSILAFPLISADELLAIVYLDHRAKKEQFGSVQVKLLGLLAEQLASIVQHARDLEASRRIATSFPGIVGQSDALRTVLRKAQRVAASDVPILILGETGVGKDLLARSIHELSDRSSAHYQEVNCAAIPRDLLEAELFGAARGAYTGSTQDRAGHFGVAEGGTLFLDEIGLLPLDAQGKLLTVLQKGMFTRVGETRQRTSDVRIVAATNSDLAAMCREGTFRTDLYYRLNVVSLELPPLRERIEDIPALYHHFVARYAEKYGVQLAPPSRDLLEFVCDLPWPGNVRQLENVLHAAVLFAEDGRLTQQAIASALQNPVESLADEVAPYHANLGDGSTLSQLVDGYTAWVQREMLARCGGDIDEMRRRLGIVAGSERVEAAVQSGSLEDMVNEFKQSVVLRAVESAGGNRTAAAERLGIHRRTIYKILGDA